MTEVLVVAIEISPLICSSNQWTGLYIIGTSAMKRFKTLSIHIHRESVLQCCNAWFVFLLFLLSGFSYSNIYNSQDRRWSREAISLYPFYKFDPLHRHLDISLVITAESSPLHIAGSRNRTWNLWYTLLRIHCLYNCTGRCCC